MLDAKFLNTASRLYVPEMGTESVAPLLYWLVRILRPETVLEVGMGYTSVFLAKALADNAEAFSMERSMLERGDRMSIPKALDAYYLNDSYEPRLICIDRMTDTSSSAPHAVSIMKNLGIAEYCQVVEADLRESVSRVRRHLDRIDFAWIDTWDTLAFLRDYWKLIRSDGGVLALHYLMTYPEGRAIQTYLSSLRGPDGGRLEMLNLLEPHKNSQNSITVLRRVSTFEEPHDLRPLGSARDPLGALARDRPRGTQRPHESEA